MRGNERDGFTAITLTVRKFVTGWEKLSEKKQKTCPDTISGSA